MEPPDMDNRCMDSLDMGKQLMDSQLTGNSLPIIMHLHSSKLQQLHDPETSIYQSSFNNHDKPTNLLQMNKILTNSNRFTIDHFFFKLFFFLSSYGTVELFTITGFPKKFSRRAWVPLLLFNFLIAPSTLVSANDFSPHKNFLRASSSMFFSHLSSQSSVTSGFLKSFLASSKEKSSSLGITNLIFPSLSFQFLQYQRMASMLWKSLMNLQAFTGPIPSILDAQSQPHKMHMSMNSSSVRSRSLMALLRSISVRGSFLLFTSRTIVVAPNTKQSVSSVHTASTFPILFMQLHWASASPGA